MRQESKCAEAEIVTHEYDALGHQLLAVVDHASEAGRSLAGKLMIAAAGQPHHHRQRAAWLLKRAPDVNVQAILVALHLVPDDLRAHGAVVGTIAHAFPGRRRCRRPPSQLPNGRLCIGNALEGKGLSFGDATNGALLGAHDVLAIGCAGWRLRRRSHRK